MKLDKKFIRPLITMAAIFIIYCIRKDIVNNGFSEKLFISRVFFNVTFCALLIAFLQKHFDLFGALREAIENKRAADANAQYEAELRAEREEELSQICEQITVYHNQLVSLKQLEELQQKRPNAEYNETNLKELISTQREITTVRSNIIKLENKKARL